MAKARLNLRNKTDSELLVFSQQHITAMVGNPNFTTPSPTLVNFQTGHDDYESALAEAGLATEAAKQKTSAKEDKRAALEFLLTGREGYINQASGGVEAKILSANFPVRDPAAPIGELPAPIDFLATMGDHSGELDLVWSRVKGAKSYIVQHSENVQPRVWVQRAIVTRSQATVGGCTPGAVCVFRVAAVGTAGQSEWSDESVKMSP